MSEYQTVLTQWDALLFRTEWISNKARALEVHSKLRTEFTTLNGYRVVTYTRSDKSSDVSICNWS